ncbi:ABC transporter ATP-binding protein [Streptomyces sp. ST2-7A]|uniref:ABC transporter ATP-binding protein n=1 Tax=Streptomyces sp. ST2-7A TaxID=2907214 RepID=UPI001F215FB7|nr:ATP-binding cassette domain-containing protein [Streptomyces sp. ST2-7A]MCE7079465.1 ATP-binding cassette domain-containing protein [Streptomyces sp. ST2-7A]
MSRPVARVEDLRVVVGERALVDGVSLTVRAGRCTALVGPSGSGKSTAALALLGEYPAGARVDGTVTVEGRAAYIPQNPAAALNPARRSGALLNDIARLGGGRRAERRARVREALRAARLPEPDRVARRFPHQLSGGQQQRVVLAQALLAGVPVLIADEPTTGQDPLTTRRVVGELRAVLDRGIGVLLLSHDPGVVRELADQVVVLREGAVVESGPAREVSVPSGAPGSGSRSPTGPESPVATVRKPVPIDDRPELLRVEGLTAHHGHRRRGITVLRDVSLTLGAGERLAVVGSSGSGKTTLARCLAGLHRRRTGRILLAGDPLPHSVRDRRREQVAAVQYVFQDTRASFDEYRPVLEQVARSAVRLRGVPSAGARAEAEEVLASMGIDTATAARTPDGLSGGELQRAALARALLARPRVLVCDEITSALDPETRSGVRDLLTGLTSDPDRAVSLVLVTHDLSLARELADRVVVLDGGEVVESGPARTVLTAPDHPVTRRLLEALPVPAAPVPDPAG